MFDKKYPPSDSCGRPLRFIVNPSRGKKHYWGVKGKNYGFYTSPQQEHMNSRVEAGRRIRTDMNNYDDPGTFRQKLRPYESKRTYTVDNYDNSIETIQQKLGRQHATKAVQSDNPEDVGYEKEYNIKEKLKQCREKLDRMKEDYDFVRKNYEEVQKLPQIRKRGDSLEAREEKRQSQSRMRNSKGLVRFSSEQKVPIKKASLGNSLPKERIVYYQKPNRANNPTYCNSFAYPLPCYRYII